MKKIIIFLLAGAGLLIAQPDNFYKNYEIFLKKYVNQGLVNYRGVIKNKSLFNEIVEGIGKFDPGVLKDKTVKKAYLINVYNISVIANVINNYPVENPLKVANFFKNKNSIVGGEKYSLDEIEHGLVFPIDNDPRLHFAMVCAARGCPELLDIAYKPEVLEKMLSEKSDSTVNSIKFVKHENGVLYLSEIFKWYKKDFGGEDKLVIRFINNYLPEKIPENVEIEYMKYDWRINEFK